MVVKQSWI